MQIKMDDIIDNFQDYLRKRNYFFYNIETKEQILDFKKTKYYEDFHEVIRSETFSSYYDNKIFNVDNEFNANLTVIMVTSFFMSFLENNNIDISNAELINNNDVNIDYYELVYNWLNLDASLFRKKAYEQGIF